MWNTDSFKSERFLSDDPMRGSLALIFLLVGIGSSFLFSASWHFARTVFDDPFRIWWRQLTWMVLGSAAGFAVYRTPYQYIKRSVPWLVWASLGLNLLTYVPGVGYTAGGARRWIGVLGLTFQPSELTRVVLILYMSRMMEKNQGDLKNVKDSLIPPLLVVLCLVLSIYFQNDFSTVAFLLAISLMLMFVSGVSKNAFLTLLVSGLVVSGAMLVSKPYRLERLSSWFSPQSDPRGSGYQLLMAKDALERGGLWGRGVGQSMVKRGSLPSAHSDFIAAVIGEEVGLFGLAVIMVLFTILAVKVWRTAFNSNNVFARCGIFGLITAIYWQVLVNLAVVAGALPATGIPLPFFSAGGSAVFISLLSFGVIFNLAENGL